MGKHTCIYRKLLKWMDLFPIQILGLLAILNMPYIFYMFGHIGKIPAASAFERNLFLSVGVCLILTIVTSKRLIRLLKFILFIIAIIASILDSFSVYQYGHPFNSGMLDILISTNQNEAKEYVSQFISARYLIGLLVSFFIMFLGYWICKRNVKRINSKILLVFVGGLVALNVFDVCRIGYDTWWMHTEKSFLLTRFTNLVRRTCYSIKEYEEYESKSGNNTVTVIEDGSNIPYVVFILGESTSKNHMSLYGYELETTPRLQKRYASGNLYVFSDAVSPHSHTLSVMRELFTFYGRGAVGEWFSYNNLFDILRETEYKTAWISNQESSGVWSLDKFYSKRCDTHYFTNVRDSRDDDYGSLDEALLPVIKNMEYSSKNFLVIHLMGTHSGYKNRYPRNFSKFKETDELKGNGKEQKQIRAEYDNAVLYNDCIVDVIMGMFEEKDAIVIYVSDHADEVYEDRDFMGHDESDGTKYMIEIPMLIWTSKTFNEKRPELSERLKNSTDRPFMTDDMIHVLLDIMQIYTPEFEPRKSVINEAFEITERTYSGMVYEKINNQTILR